MKGLHSSAAEDFPILRAQPGERPLVYLDNAATTQKPEAVIRRLTDYYSRENANIHRGGYPLSLRAEQLYEQARRRVQAWLGALSPREVVFTKSSTEGLNLLAHAGLDAWAGPGDNVVVTELEHASNYYPFRRQCDVRQVEFRVAAARQDGWLDPEAVEALLDSRTKLVSVTAMSNVTGFRPNLEAVIRAAHRVGARVAVDASQEIAHRRVDVGALDCDFLCFSGHKVYGPTGCGVLYGKEEALAQLSPWLYGGGMLEQAGPGGTAWKDGPDRFEAGSPDVASVLGLAAALDYLEGKGVSELFAYEAELSRYLRERLGGVPGVQLHGPDCPSPILTFSVKGWAAYDVGVLLGRAGVAVRCGAHCAYPLMERMGLDSSCRVSLGIYNSAADVDLLAQELERMGRAGYVCSDP